MSPPSRTSPSNLIGGLAIAGLLVLMCGCTQLNGNARLPWLASDPPVEAPADNYTPPAPTAVASPESSEIRLGQKTNDGPGEIRQAAHTERHVVHQNPAGNTLGLPPQSTTTQNQVIQNQNGQVVQANVGNQTVGQGGSNVAQVQGIRPLDIPPAGVQGPYNYQPPVTPGEGAAFPPIGPSPVYTPNVREADLIINGFPARTGRITFGAAVNSDAGVTGQITIDERNFDICRWPRSFQDLFRGNAFRGKGQTLRIEATPGSDFDRYIIQFANPNLFTYLPITMSLSGFLYDRRFDDWSEQRLGGRVAFGYRLTPDLSLSVGVSGQNVEIYDPRVSAPPTEELEAVSNRDNGLYAGSVSLKHDTRNSPIQASDGHYFEMKYEQAFGDFDYPRFDLEYRTYWLLAQRADFSGKQTLSYSTQLGFSGDDTPIFENYFAGGYATLRGFDFRGASPVSAGGIEVGGRFQWLNAVEYMFPITADDAFRGVAFVDFGTVERNVTLNDDTFRVAPGLGLRVAIPMLGPAPLAFDFAYPVAKADTDRQRIFSFYMSVVR